MLRPNPGAILCGHGIADLHFASRVVVDPNFPVERWHLAPRGIERIRKFAAGDVPRNVRHIWASTETKAIEAAGILAGARGLGIDVDAELGENDRGVAGFLPPAEFEQVADSFFAHPDKSIRGWERATDAQARIVGAVTAIAARHRIGDLAIVGHGAVGTLLHAAYSGQPISWDGDRPFQGHYWTASLPDLVPHHCWRAIAPR